MEFNIYGDYFFNQFHLSQQNKWDQADELIIKVCPANIEHTLWQYPVEYQNVEKVIESALVGFKIWKKTSFSERCEILTKVQENITRKKEQLALSIAYETGKPLWEAQTEVTGVINKVRTTIEDSLPRIKHQFIENIMPHTHGHVHHKPLGPCLIIGPFNFPAHLANGQILSALIAGNSIIFKPSEKTIYSAQLLIECFIEASFPMGVLNLINGGKETTTQLIKSSGLRGIFFTGSKEVGQSILGLTHRDLTKQVALELGGKNTSIIHQDANIDYSVNEMVNSCFLTTGQRCTSTSLIALHKTKKDEFIEKFIKKVNRLIIDHPITHKQEPFMGPLIDEKAVESYLIFLGMGKREGAEEFIKGRKLTDTAFKGHYVSPSIFYLTNPNSKSLFFQSEIFGPSCTIYTYEDIEEVVENINSAEYGLAASIFTESQSLYQYCLQEIDIGLLNFNRGTIGASAKLPFGGVKSSGNFHPAAVSMIDSCVYPLSGLETIKIDYVDIQKGLRTDGD
jgi:succinylglutamic semialdehyde dehydrogenase